jgi:hypothetical protein
MRSCDTMELYWPSPDECQYWICVMNIAPAMYHNYDNPVTRGHRVLIGNITISSLSTLVVGLRLYTRIRITRTLGLDYAFSVLGLVSFFPSCSFCPHGKKSRSTPVFLSQCPSVRGGPPRAGLRCNHPCWRVLIAMNFNS